MKRNRILALVFATCMFVATTAGLSLAQSSPNYELSWTAIGSGGRRMQSPSYVVMGTVGQSAPRQPASTSTNYVVSGGFWAGVDTGDDGKSWLPTILRLR